jgi:hypothetical protein
MISIGSQLIVDGLIWTVVSVDAYRVVARRQLSNGKEDSVSTAVEAVSDMGNGLYCLPGRIESRSDSSVVAQPAVISTE